MQISRDNLIRQKWPDIASVFERAIAYLESRQCSNGGFCFYRTNDLDEPNLADTYHAVRVLHLLGQTIPRQADAIAFARRFLENLQPIDRYHSAFVLRTLIPDYSPDRSWVDQTGALPILPPPAPDSPALTGWLTRTRTTVRLKRLFTAFSEADDLSLRISGLARPGGGFGVRPNLWDTWLALDVLDACDKASQLRSTSAFLDRVQTPTFGFDTIEGAASSHLDSVFAGVRCCAFLQQPIRFGAAATSFVLGCQGDQGGFARSFGALPDIELTHKAIWTLVRLSQSHQ